MTLDTDTFSSSPRSETRSDNDNDNDDTTSIVSPMGKLDSILFDSDDGPASSIFQASDSSGDFDDSGEFLTPSPSSLSTPSALTKTPPSLRAAKIVPRNVKFDSAIKEPPLAPVPSPASTSASDSASTTPTMGAMTTPTASHSNATANAHDVVVEKLRDQLHRAQASLATEKTNRKRKEKSLIKLAKELNNRASDTSHKDAKLAELSETVQDLMARLAHKAQAAREQQEHHDTAATAAAALFHQRSADEAERLAALEHRVQTSEAQRAEAQARADRVQAEARIEVVRAREAARVAAAAVREPPRVVKATIQETVVAAPESVTASSTAAAAAALSPPPVSRSPSILAWIPALLVGLALPTVVAVAVAGNAVCAPAPPGHTLLGAVPVQWVAPWWAPDAVKGTAHTLLCGDRPRTVLTVHGTKQGRVTVTTIVGDGTVEDGAATTASTVLWEGRAEHGLTVHADSLTVFRKKRGVVEDVVAPWSML